MDRAVMELAPCNESARQALVDNLYCIRDGTVDKKIAVYVAKTFPDILLDVARLLTEQATNNARQSSDQAVAIRQQLKPFFMFSFLLGKAPQISNLMYSYFENSLFQPLPEDLFQCLTDAKGHRRIVYYPGFSDDLVKEILTTYLTYLSFNPKWFSAVWNWCELGRIIASHPNYELRYLAACCLSVITKPTRHQHISLMHDLIRDNEMLIDLQIKYCHIYDNTFKPVIETKTVERVHEFIRNYGGPSVNGYSYCTESLANVTNILLLKRDISPDCNQSIKNKINQTVQSFVPVETLSDTISKIAYSVSINKPCLIRGPAGSGKTAILDYIAAHTNRLNPPEYVKVQIGDQIDSKLIVGSYVCTEIPGQFEWQPGPLTQAMAYGSWIVFEDIDSAPSEMAQVIHSVIENGSLSCVSSCPVKLDSPHPDFRIFFTQRTRRTNAPESLKLGFGFVERLCDVVDMPELSDSDLRIILERKFNFGPLKDTILQLYQTSTKTTQEASTSRPSRIITLRDLFKFCDRVSMREMQVNEDKYASNDLDALLFDAIDCFLAYLPKVQSIAPSEKLGQILNKPSNEINGILLQRRPEIREESGSISIGRARLEALETGDSEVTLGRRTNLAHTRQSLQLMESVSLCIKHREPVLLVGETGVGKTTIVQHLADSMRVELVVINLSQQSDSSDLLGGYRPVEMREVVKPLNDKFVDLFKQTFDVESNRDFLQKAEGLYMSSRKCSEWVKYLKVLCCLCGKSLERRLSKAKLDEWSELMSKARKLSKRVSEEDSSPMALSFSEGSLLRAVKQGKWILLDEINLAEPDVLQCLLLILDSLKDSHIYLNGCEGEGLLSIHPNFRIFACMNPSTDVGKRDLSIGVRGRFTEFFVDDVNDKHDLRLIVESYVKTCLKPPQIEKIVNFYQEIRAKSNILNDISGNSPVYSLRTLCRALTISAQNVCHNMEKSLYESLKITFLQQLNESSVIQVLTLIESTVFDNVSVKKINETTIQMPQDNHQYVQVEGFWVQASSQKRYVDENYIVTPSVKKNLKRLARIISLGQRKLPILIQGNTSVGKTSLIRYLARQTGNMCYRINNHEHTDLQEYVGRYMLKEDGELQFQEGLLVTAMRKGYWVILDELNLAPCELLEALNRVLDDNRELFIPETRESIKAHSKFVLFATQNPPEEYAGRKLLSRAFRNRFIELHFDEIPHNELEEILHRRCKMPPQYARKIVTVMRELQIFRRESGCFNGKNSFMTMRDLFRWGERYAIFKDKVRDDQFLDWDNFIASEGLILLEGRVRTKNEADIVKSIVEKVFRRSLDRNAIYAYNAPSSIASFPLFKHVHFTPEFKKLFVQLTQALKYKEPVLLCGQTGCGKTTACQLYAELEKQNLIIYNCHLNTESQDFVGDVRPIRVEQPNGKQQMFSWLDGPLVQAMRSGSVFLMDEISLADDAVLERINSVLEPGRSITLTEKDGEEVLAKETFRFVATMNPGGDYGKKELSPALRNRFTEIYCHNTSDIAQVIAIIEKSLSPPLLTPKIAPGLINVMKQFLKEYYKDQNIISLRDILNWTKFLNKTTHIAQVNPLSVQEAIINGASLVFFDQFGTCGHNTMHPNASTDLKVYLESFLQRLTVTKLGKEPLFYDKIPSCPSNSDCVKIDKFCLAKGLEAPCDKADFILETPVVALNIQKLVRAMQLDRPILLEGDPGAGKTSIVAALAKLSCHKLVRINLSEQTDINDLIGSDLPDTTNLDESTPRFCWHDGPLLKAIKDSSWVLLDEMNLASQSVLEGLNACFDHRGEIYIPELNKRFNVDRSSTRIFACQNPYNQGASRKGLPQSFLNRFTSIFIESHSPNDLSIILQKLYPNLSEDIIDKMILFNTEVRSLYQDQGYEFNLRDLIYWCDLLTKYVRAAEMKELNLYGPDRFVQFVYLDRMRSISDKIEISEQFEKVFGYPVYEPLYREIRLGEYSLTIARSILSRKTRCPPHLSELCILKYQMPYLESIAKALEFNKMPILVGQPGVGKRSMVRILAGLTGNELNIFGANRDMDTIELLGSFEQKSLQRELVDLVEDAGKFVRYLINSTPLKTSASTWSQLYKHIWSTLYATSIRDLRLSNSEMMDAYRFQLNQMEELIERIQPYSTSQTESKFKDLKTRIFCLKKKLLYNSESMYSSGNFEWIDSLLIRSIREGSWLMIEDANLMNPATLDRLNSLVEPGGSLSLNEKGSGPDDIETLVPHPDFRLILTMNPEHGELSRAMRNRGVEIFIRTRFYFEDFLIILNQNGFEPEEKKACMTYCIMQTSYDTHLKITDEEPAKDGSLLAYFGLNYLTYLAHQIRRGLVVDKILADLIISYYTHKGYLEESANDSIRLFVADKMSEYRKKYVVDLNDNRYNWCNMRHDLVSMTGGDAILSMLVRDNKLFWVEIEPVASGLLRIDEIVDSLDIVNSCLTVKIFLELATHGDLEHRKGFIRQTFSNIPKMMEIVNNQLDSFLEECVPLINNMMPRSQLLPVSEMYIDTRNSPDLQYYLKSFDYQETSDREDMQNRWILSLHRITIKMIIELIEERSLHTTGNTSLWTLSEQVRTGKMLKEDLIRPNAEIATDLHDLLTGILRVASDRCFENRFVTKMLARLFWIGYFICKLRRGYNKLELIAICNQIPMLWALTYQKVIVPIIKDCDLADLSYNNRKFSNRIQHICDFLDVTIAKPSSIEKAYYNKVLNMYAVTTKRCESISREIDKFFALVLGRYTLRSQSLSLGSDGIDTLAASGLVWSNSIYMSPLYRIEDKLFSIESADESTDTTVLYNEAKKLFMEKRCDYVRHEDWLKNEQYRAKCLTINRRRNALDQFAPVWQVKFIQERISQLHPCISNPEYYQSSFRHMIKSVNGIIISPRYYATLIKFLQVLENRKKHTSDNSFDDEESFIQPAKIAQQNVDMCTAFLVDHLLENIVLDNQIVGWTKLRVTTSDLSSSAPLIPEYSPVISLVSSYCLDITHLKLNSYQDSSAQLDSMLVYLWRAYAQIKFDSKNSQDLVLAQNLMHLRLDLGLRKELVGSYRCSREQKSCRCIEEYIRRRAPKYDEVINVIEGKSDHEDVSTVKKAIKLIYFGFYNSLEYAPIFTLDPSLRSREKLEIYKSELAHIKLDLNQRNILYYWKTGENLRLLDISPEEAKLYPFSLRVLIERRAKLEKSLHKLRREHTNRPKSDDGALYYELRKEVEIGISRYTSSINSLINDILAYINCKKHSLRSAKLSNLVSKCRMLIKSLERSITQFKSDYVLYSDLTTNYLVGMCFVLQGMRRLYSRMEQKLQLQNSGFTQCLVDKFSNGIIHLFSFNNFILGNMESVNNKRGLYPLLGRLCPEDKVSYTQSLLLRSILIQLNHHIVMTPSDIKKCIPIVRNIADKFHSAWLERKKYLEEQRKKQEELYQYKTSRTTLGNEISLERREFIEICTKFPTYDHVYQTDVATMPTSADEENLETEAKIINLHRSVDLSMCIDICKAHYKFMKEASLSLLGQQSSKTLGELKSFDMDQLIRLEAEIMYTVIRHCIPNLDRSFDSLSIECHLLQANELHKVLRQNQPETFQLGSLKSSIDILDEEIFDIYHNSNAFEALKFQSFIANVDSKINALRCHPTKSYDAHPALCSISKLVSRISSFLITDPLMKFVSGAHILLKKLEDWNQSVMRDSRLNNEVDELVELIKSWREIEVRSWRSSLHRVKRKYIDDTLCDLWFRLYEAFNDPIKSTTKMLIDKGMVDEDFELTLEEYSETLYQGFVLLIKEFFEDATLGDYQIRLDLVFSFAIQTRFASLYEQARLGYTKMPAKNEPELKVDYEKLTTYVYNIYRQYQGLMEPFKEILEQEEASLTKGLNEEIRIVAWQGRSSLWDIKNNFRISHRKLNKVMSKYLEVLRRPFPSIKPQGNVSEKRVVDLNSELSSTKLETILKSAQMIIDGVKTPTDNSINLLALKRAPTVVQKMKRLSQQVLDSAKSRYTSVLVSFEQTSRDNTDSILSFHSHKVHELVINPRDSKEIKAEKFKHCRQMYHSKKFAMQAVFKNLKELGVSYQRGLNNSLCLDGNILSLEPLRGMIQHQSKLVLKAASELIEDSLVISCNEMYRALMTRNHLLLSQPKGDDLTSDQMQRIQGYAYDMVLDIITHNKNAAIIYRHLMDVQASATRLRQLQDRYSSGKVTIYNFSRIHNSVRQFNELVSRAYSAISKLEKLMECFKTSSELDKIIDKPDSKLQKSPDYKSERIILKEIINEIDEKKSLMTREQCDHIQRNLDHVRKSIAEVSCELRDKLNYTIRNYLYSEDDIEQLHGLYERFTQVFSELIPQGDNFNIEPTTILGSMNSLLIEAEQTLKPMLEPNYLKGHNDHALDLENHPNVNKLNIRLLKLANQTKLATQGIYKDELDFNTTKIASESYKRKLMPFNHIDSSRIRSLLRAGQVARHTANCFMTLNLEDRCTDIETIVSGLTPILFIYTQNVASFLNVILNALRLKLITANQLIPFFTDLVVNGFGLPCKLNELDTTEDRANGKLTENNTGFGEGQGKEDASKKLEFESQLDELKKDDQSKENQDELDKSEPVEAQDDGIEMTDDIDARAEGPEDGEHDDDDDDGDRIDDEEGLNELDKEMDNVDNDEGNLDQDLWGDKDEPLEEDGEEDLRDADADPSIKPEIDEKCLEAKNKELAQSTDQMDAKDSTEPIEDDIQETTNEQDQIDEQLDGSQDENGQLDLEEEAARAQEENPDYIGDLPQEEEVNDEIQSEGFLDGASDITDEENENFNQSTKQDSDVEVLDESEKDVSMEMSEDDKPGSPILDVQNVSRSGEAGPEELGQGQENQSSLGTEGEGQEGEEPKDGGVAQAQEGDNEEGETSQDQKDAVERSSKRTLAEQSMSDQSTIKRQKIAPAGDDEQIQNNDEKGEDKSYRHMEIDQSNAIEVIDLASDSDDYLLDLGEPLEQIGQVTSSKPKESKEQGKDSKADGDEKAQGENSTYNTNLGLLKYISHHLPDAANESEQCNGLDNADLMERIDNELNKKSIAEHESLDTDVLLYLWLECTKSSGHLVHELCQQLQIVLQPTKMSKYKGDYKSGKRLNMRKIISYIASHYRKDKIWLRRTKPCKRTYNISLAVDNSSSMSENNCRQMTYQSLALLAKSLSLIEAGSLNVISFGEQVRCIHDFGQPYVEAIGAQWLRELRFNERRTSYSKMLKYSCDSFAKQALLTQSQLDTQTSVNQLLIIISDGRNVTSESEDVKYFQKQLKSMRVLTLFVIIDDLKRNDGKSIVDVKSCVKFGSSVLVENYMKLFPFPFYVLLRQLETMPSILGDALRQWFELVSNGA